MTIKSLQKAFQAILERNPDLAPMAETIALELAEEAITQRHNEVEQFWDSSTCSWDEDDY